MAKLKLEIVKYHMIIMRKIVSVTIDGVEFKKSEYAGNSRVLQIFYNFVKRNKYLITFICYKDHSVDEYDIHMYLKNCKLHCEFGQAYYRLYFDDTISSSDNYYLDDEKLDFAEWKQRLRKIKLKKIREVI